MRVHQIHRQLKPTTAVANVNLLALVLQRITLAAAPPIFAYWQIVFTTVLSLLAALLTIVAIQRLAVEKQAEKRQIIVLVKQARKRELVLAAYQVVIAFLAHLEQVEMLAIKEMEAVVVGTAALQVIRLI